MMDPSLREVYIKVGRKYKKIDSKEEMEVIFNDFARMLRSAGLENLAAIYSSFKDMDQNALVRLDRDIGRMLVNRALRGG